jgi:hypothetical protein
MHLNHAKKTEIRGGKGNEPVCPSDPPGETGIAGQSGGAETFAGRISGTAGSREAFDRVDRLCIIAGGIVSQLIADAESQLANARACVEWYQQEEAKALQRLEHLRQLQQGDGSNDILNQ